MCTDGQPRTSCVLTDTHGNTRTATDVLCVLTDTHGRPVCADGHPRTSSTDVLCVLADTHGRPVCTKQTAHVGQNHPNSPREGSAVLSPRTNVLICVLMDSHGRPVYADGHTRTAMDVLCVLTDTHGRPVCADGHPQTACDQRADMCTDGQPRTSCTSCVCWRTPTDVLCVLNSQPTWTKITQTIHRKGQHAESKDQRADLCTDGQPRTSYILCVLTDTHRHTRTGREVLCVLTDTHGHPVCTEQTAHGHGRPVCADRHRQTHTDSHGRPVYCPHWPKSPEQSTGRVSVLSPRTNVLICLLMDSHGRPVCADGHTRTHTDSHGRPVCADGHTRTQPTWAKITQTVHGEGQRAESKDQRADMYVMCVLTDTNGHTWTHTDIHGRTVCADGQPQTATDVLCVLADTHGRLVTNVLICVLMDSHGRPVCSDGHTGTQRDSHGRPVCKGSTHMNPWTSCVCWRTPTDILCVLNKQPTWAKMTQTVHGKGQRAESKDQLHGKSQRAESKDQRADMCTDGQPQTSCVHTRTHTDSHGHPVCAGGHPRTQPTCAKITRTVHGKGQRAEASMPSPRTNVLICVLMDSHGRPMSSDGHTGTQTDSHGRPVHGRLVCADGQPQTAMDVLCVLADTHGHPVCTEQTAHSTGRASMLCPRTNVLICVLIYSHGRPVCADGHRQTHTDSHGRPVCAGGHPQTSCTAHVGQNHPNSPREGPAC
ncbi:unnamed protein product [Brassica rapa]|uniref:Uncharacterized protein n=1 Tax=Brassica campestris TaxID=3711 RepID=A0A8D9G082_BRACM|nr:unnamed protein product [Brassica rapa]